MAVGDVISIIGPSGATMTYQPAAGTESMISQIDLNGANRYQKFDGVTASNGFNHAELLNAGNLKIFVNNTDYMIVLSGGAGVISAICGIQIK
jgi:hypothetical protein|tara:strand:+ start:1048 stop:1326 length:279 start_codon:yes stop_codon:yes gene_type:complete